LPLDGLELAHAHGHRQTFLIADTDFRLICTMTARKRDGVRGDGLQRFSDSVLIHCRDVLERVRSEF
jgi:hypothetical protein